MVEHYINRDNLSNLRIMWRDMPIMRNPKIANAVSLAHWESKTRPIDDLKDGKGRELDAKSLLTTD